MRDNDSVRKQALPQIIILIIMEIWVKSKGKETVGNSWTVLNVILGHKYLRLSLTALNKQMYIEMKMLSAIKIKYLRVVRVLKMRSKGVSFFALNASTHLSRRIWKRSSQ